MSGLDDERVAFPAPGGKAVEGVQRFRRRMRPAVEPDDAVDAERAVEPDRLGDAADAIVLRVHDQRVGAPKLIGRRMRRALMLGHAKPGTGVALGLANARFVERKTQKISDLRTRTPVVEIFVTEKARMIPCTREVDLSERTRNRRQREREGNREPFHRLLPSARTRRRRPAGRRAEARVVGLPFEMRRRHVVAVQVHRVANDRKHGEIVVAES